MTLSPRTVARAYTLDEIDRMRAATQITITGGTHWISNGGDHIDRLIAQEKAIVEERLRAYMASNVSPDELEAEAAAVAARHRDSGEGAVHLLAICS
jgi:hypothetical protein